MGRLVVESLEKKLKLTKLAKAVYTVTGQKSNLKAELVFETSDGIYNLNSKERGVSSVTDVLSFPTMDGIRGQVLLPKNCRIEMDRGYIFIGSIVLCEDKIRQQALEYGNTEERERNYLIIHGLLHLLGYDHMTEEDKKQMRAKEKEVLKLLGIEDEEDKPKQENGEKPNDEVKA